MKFQGVRQYGGHVNDEATAENYNIRLEQPRLRFKLLDVIEVI